MCGKRKKICFVLEGSKLPTLNRYYTIVRVSLNITKIMVALALGIKLRAVRTDWNI